MNHVRGDRRDTAGPDPSAAVKRDTNVNEVDHTQGTTRGDQLRRVLENDILSGRLTVGTRLDETTLAERFEVSRTPVREALKQLASSGLVEIRPRQGAFVTELTMAELLELFELMGELEAVCAGLAARRMTLAERNELVGAHEHCTRVAETGEAETFYAANNVFHELIYRGTHNRFVERDTRELRSRLQPYRRFITFRPGRLNGTVEEHATILKAVVDGDEVKARAAMHQHLSVLADDMLEINRGLESQRRRLADAGT